MSWIRKGLKTGVLTTRYPAVSEPMPEIFRGRLVFDPGACKADLACEDCIRVCPTRALSLERDEKGELVQLRLDLGACILCQLCVEACPEGAFRMTPDYETAVRQPEDLWTDLLYHLGPEDENDEHN